MAPMKWSDDITVDPEPGPTLQTVGAAELSHALMLGLPAWE